MDRCQQVPHEGGLPPFVIVAIQDVEGITVFEGEACRGVDVFNGVVVKESFVCVCVWGGGYVCVCEWEAYNIQYMNMQ